MRKIIIAGNWKMNKTIAPALELANAIKREVFKIADFTVDAVLCPPFTALSEVAEVINDTDIKLGAQDVHWEKEGAFTGEVSCDMLKDCGCTHVIIGHSERRQFFGETNATVNKKVEVACKAQMIPIMCVGETLAERESGATFSVLEDHVKNGLAGIGAQDIRKIIIAYEPVWAIGTGKTATSPQAQEAHNYIRGILVKLYDADTAAEVRIQYGGSVKPENIEELLRQPDIDGALVGGASIKADSFSDIIRKSCGVKK